MGCGYSFTCKTCKVTYDLGYSSYGSWLYAVTIDQLLNHEDEKAKRSDESANLLYCLIQHQGHSYELWHHDYYHVEDGNIVSTHGNFSIAENIADFTEIDMDDMAVRERLFNEAGFDPNEWIGQQETP